MVCMSMDKNDHTRPTTIQWSYIANGVIKRSEFPYHLNNSCLLSTVRIVSLCCV